MSRYIDAEKIPYETPCGFAGCDGDCANCKAKDIAHKVDIDTIPTADVIDVVRCKDCKYFTHYKCKPAGTESVRCALDGLTNGENDYCSYGERR